MGLEGQYEELADELSRVAEAIRTEQPVSLSRLARAIETTHASWVAQCVAAAETGITGLSRDLLDPAGLRAAKAEQERRRRAALTARITRTLDIIHRSEPRFEPLEQLERSVREAVATIEAGAEPATLLPPFDALTTLIEQGSALADETADQLHTAITEAFGPKLALAATRGRLIFGTPPAGGPPPPSDRPTSEAGPPDPSFVAPIGRGHEPTAQADPGPGDLVALAVAIPDPVEPDPVEPQPAAAGPAARTPDEPPVLDVATAMPAEPAPPDPDPLVPLPPEPAPVSQEIGPVLAEPIWRVLELGYPGLAYHLASHSAASPGAPTGSALCALLVFAPMADGSGLIDPLVREHSASLFETVGTLSFDHPVRLVTHLAALRVGLLAPESGAGAVLAQPQIDAGRCPALARIAEAAAACAGHHITPFLLSGDAGEDRWRERVAALAQHAARWLDRQVVSHLSGGRTTAVWQNWTSAERPIGRMIRIVAEDDRANRAEAHDIGESLAIEFAAQLMRTDHALHGVRAARLPLTTREKGLLQERVQQARALVRRWEGLLDSQPQAAHPAREAVARLRRILADDRAAALDEIAALTPGRPEIAAVATTQLDAAAAMLAGAVPDAPAAVGSLSDRPLVAALDLELLLVAELDIGADLTLAPGIVPDPAAIIDAAEQSDWGRATAKRIERHDFPGAGLCLDVVERRRLPNLASLQEWWQAALSKAQHDIARRQAELLHLLAGSAALEEIPPGEQMQLEAAIRIALPPPGTDIRSADAALLKAADRLTQLAAAARERVEREFDEAEFRRPPSMVKRVQKLIKAGRLELARDYIERLRQGLDLPKHDELAAVWGSAFPLFFGPFIDQATALQRARGSLSSIRDAISTAPRFLEPLEVLGGDEALRREALDMLDCWELAKRRGDEEAPRGVQRLFELLQFHTPKLYKYLVPPRSAITATLHLQSAVICDRDTVVVPTFGSGALGHYRIVLVWGNLTAQQMVTRVVESVSVEGGPIIVLCFRPLDRAERLALARLAATTTQAPIAVLDELLLLFLAQYQTSGRLKAFFDCTLPFTALEPYAAEGVIAPPEMQFGRRLERAEIGARDDSGSLFVHGGRRLGKTTLLHGLEVEAATDQRERLSSIVRYIDIGPLGRSPASPPRGITRLMAEHLRERGVPVAATDAPPEFQRKLRDWLDEPEGAGGRRILMLLDDAESFLSQDARDGFPEMQQIQQLMLATGHRFRVVLSGIQHVGTILQDPGFPPGRNARATLVRPLLRGADLRDAERLVRQPLESLGYVFSTDAAVSQVLSHCQGDPSLIQMFCRQLLANMRQRWIDEREPTLPCPIGPDEVAEVYQHKPIRDAIDSRVQMNLDLDERYPYLSRLISVLAGGDLRRSLVDGVALGDIHDQALMDWPEGFGDATGVEEFRVVLDEMVDLSLIRLVGPDTYALHWANLPRRPGSTTDPQAPSSAEPRGRGETLAFQPVRASA